MATGLRIRSASLLVMEGPYDVKACTDGMLLGTVSSSRCLPREVSFERIKACNLLGRTSPGCFDGLCRFHYALISPTANNEIEYPKFTLFELLLL